MAYRAYLRDKGVSYIIAGDTSLDCKAAVEKLKRLLMIDTILICGGGTVNWTFIQQDVVDVLPGMKRQRNLLHHRLHSLRSQKKWI